MSFAENLKRILSKLEISDKDRIEYTEDAIAIQNFVIDQLKANDATFRNAFGGLSLGGSYLDRVKLVTPDEFDLHLKLRFSYQITPKKDERGFVFLYAPGGGRPIVRDGYINRDDLQGWLRGIFNNVFKSGIRVSANHDTYTLKYTLAGYGCAHTIEAVGNNHELSFDLVPVFEFPPSLFPFDIPSSFPMEARKYSWFAVPQKKSGSYDNRTFVVCAPHWEREMVKNSYNFKNVLRLMKGIKDSKGREFLPHLSSYMLKTVMLHKHSSVNWQQDEGSLLLEMWNSLVNHLYQGRLEFILANGHNIFDRMNNSERSTCFNTAQSILNQLKQSHTQDNFNQLSKMFD